VSLAKTADRDRPQTVYRVTALGRKRYLVYLAVLEQVILDGAAATKTPLPEPGGSRTVVTGRAE
jgi:hypothetical protein